ncbi:MAG: Spy/CpxP family protein refolding chaperone [Thiobacillus sp.]|nr:Spy/CpxP family protein refolding chaperone [Thiobacillus sp.]
MKSNQGVFAKRILLAGLVAGSGMLAVSAFAMPEGAAAAKPGCESRQGHANREAQRAERMSALKDKLQLAPTQEAAWNAFVGAGQSGLKRAGGDRQAMHAEFAKLSTPERLDRMQAMSDMRRVKMAERTEAIKAFYGQLTPAQRTVFDGEVMQKRQRGHHGRHGHRHHA